MAYLGDIRENGIGPNGEIWENDNRKDARYYWNGAYIDLCDLPAEDYAKTIFVTNGATSDVEPSKTTNTITVELVQVANSDGNLVYAYKATAKKPVASDIDVMITIKGAEAGNETVTITLKNGESTTSPILTNIVVKNGVAEPTIVTSNYKKEDDEFKYSLILPAEKPVLPMAYSITLMKGEIDSIDDNTLIAKLKENGTLKMKDETVSENFKIDLPYIPIEGLQQLSPLEQRKALIDNSADFIIVTDKNIVDIEQVGAGISEIDVWTKKDKTISFDGATFTVWYKRDENNAQSRIIDPETGYKLGPKEDVEYIIYYK